VKHEVKKGNARHINETTNECMDKKLTLNELQAALTQTAKGKEISRPRCNHK